MTQTLAQALAAGGPVDQLAQQHKRSNLNSLPYSYGTSGFRGLASILPSVTVRMGLLACVRSLSHVKPGQSNAAPVCGVMLTASHNDACDNGVKLIDASGEMLDTNWESDCTELANEDEHNVVNYISKLMQQHVSDGVESTARPRVFIGRDTRASSAPLSLLLQQSIEAMHGQCTDFGLVTTPQLHYMVRCANTAAATAAASPPVLQQYYNDITRAFQQALELSHSLPTDYQNKLQPLLVDCSNGVGSYSMLQIQKLLAPQCAIQLINTVDEQLHSSGVLNHRVGAEFVQKSRVLPENAASQLVATDKCCSLDGDADRIVYYFQDEKKQFQLCDGDKIISLYANFIVSLLDASALRSQLSVGIVQTAYANGASTLYMQHTLKMPIQCTPTGVKHLHHVATQYDVGIYFESNGHGTCVFSANALRVIDAAAQSCDHTTPAGKATLILQQVPRLINQCVGDAVCDLLLCELALHHLQWSMTQWNAIYHDLPSVQLKVKVQDRNAITTTDAERKCLKPEGLQAAIDALIQQAPAGSSDASVRRAFVRPSGTEDVVRVYAEASTPAEAQELADAVAKAVSRLAGGI